MLLGPKLDITFDREREVLRALRALFSGKPPSAEQTPVAKASGYLKMLAEAYGTLPTQPFRSEPPLVGALAFDASALTALACGDVRARSYLARGVGSVARFLVPATVLLDPHVAAVADAFAEVRAIDAAAAREAARLLANAAGGAPLEALFVASVAREASSAIVTANGADYAALVSAARRDLHIFAV